MTWEAHNHFGDLLGSGEEFIKNPAGAEVRGKWDWKSARSIDLTLKVYRPTGFEVYSKLLTWRNPIAGGQTAGEMKVRDQIPRP